MVITKVWDPVFRGADTLTRSNTNWLTVAMLSLDGRLWFFSRGERGDGRGGCCQNQQHWAYHAAQGCSRCHSTHGCLGTSTELAAGVLGKKKKKPWHLLILPLTSCRHRTTSNGSPSTREILLLHGAGSDFPWSAVTPQLSVRSHDVEGAV